MDTLRTVAEKWLNAYNTRDAYALIEIYHDDAENHQVAFGAPTKGREALLESFIMFFTAFPDSYTHPINILEDGEWVVIEWRGGGTFLGPLGDQQPNGRSFTLQGCGFMQVVDGKIKFQRGYIDRQTWFEQLGMNTGQVERQI